MGERISPQSCFAELNGTRIHYRVHGPEDGQPVLFLHGWPQSGEMWLAVLAALGDGIRAIVPDLRGFGLSETPEGRYDAPIFLEDQVALLDYLELESAHLVGHDWGGWTTFLACLDRPERVRSALVINAPHPWPRIGPRTTLQLPHSWYAALVATPLLGPWAVRDGHLVRLILEHWSHSTIDAEAAERYARSFALPGRPTAVSKLYRYYWKAFLQAASGRWNDRQIGPPVRLMFGVEDRMVKVELIREGLVEHCREAEVELVANASHFLCDERPLLVADRITFLAQQPAKHVHGDQR